jgi:hypothetical protein
MYNIAKGLAERSANVYRSFTVCAITSRAGRGASAAQGGKKGPANVDKKAK